MPRPQSGARHLVLLWFSKNIKGMSAYIILEVYKTKCSSGVDVQYRTLSLYKIQTRTALSEGNT